MVDPATLSGIDTETPTTLQNYFGFGAIKFEKRPFGPVAYAEVNAQGRGW